MKTTSLRPFNLYPFLAGYHVIDFETDLSRGKH